MKNININSIIKVFLVIALVAAAWVDKIDIELAVGSIILLMLFF